MQRDVVGWDETRWDETRHAGWGCRRESRWIGQGKAIIDTMGRQETCGHEERPDAGGVKKRELGDSGCNQWQQIPLTD
jgi:hypothetical protein